MAFNLNNNTDSGLCYVGANFYSRNDPLLSGIVHSYKDGLNLTFEDRRTAPISAASVKRLGDAPARVGGSLVSHTTSWGFIRETFTSRGAMGLVDADAARLMLRAYLAELGIVVSGLCRGSVAFEDGTSITIWPDGEQPIFTASTVWTAEGSDPVTDVLEACDKATAMGAFTPRQLFLSGSAARAFLANQSVRDTAGLIHFSQIELSPVSALSIDKLVSPREYAQGLRTAQKDGALERFSDFAFGAPMSYDPQSWAPLAEVSGVRVYRDVRGVLPDGEGLLCGGINRFSGSRDLREGDGDYAVFFGPLFPAGVRLSGEFCELALYCDRSADGASIHSFSAPAIGCIGNPWGAVSMRGLV